MKVIERVVLMVKTYLPQLMAKKKIRSISALAKATELNRRTLANIFDEKTKGIDFATIDALCGFFECSITDLMEYIPDKSDE